MTQTRSPDVRNYENQPAADRMRDMAGTAEDKLKEATASAQELAANLAEQARIYGEKAQEAAKEFRPFVEKSMKDKPMQTLAGAAVIGFLLGALWKK